MGTQEASYATTEKDIYQTFYGEGAMADDHILSRNREQNLRKKYGVNRRNFLAMVGGTSMVGTAGCLGQLSGEQEWPSRQVEIISPWAAGGGADTTSRAIADAAENFTDVSWNVSNQTGGSGSVGMQAVVNSNSNGHRLGVIAPEICLFQQLGIAELGPDSVRPLMQYAVMPAVLVVHENSQYSSLDQFVTYGRQNPGALQLANSGTGSSWHMALAGFAYEAGIEAQHVPYDGASSALTAVVNGEADATAAGPGEVAGQVKDGPLTPLGIMHDEQIETYPNTQTMQQQGINVELGSWLGGFAAPSVSDETFNSIAEVYRSVYESDGFQSFIDNSGMIGRYRNPEETRQFLDEQYQYYGELINRLNINIS